MRRAVFLPCCLTWGQIMMEVMKIMVTLLEKVPCRYCHTQCSQPCSRTPLTHTSAWDSWTLTGKSGSVSCGVTSPFSWVLVHTRFCLCPPRVCFPIPMQEPLPLWQATADPYLRRRHSNTQRKVQLSLCGASWCTQGFVWALQASLAGVGFDSRSGN